MRKKELILPEYGRNIQNMVDIALSIEDRDERNHCARSIINCMGNLFTHLRDNEQFNHKLWDHLAIMSDFKLDIDYPYTISNETILTLKPQPLPLGQTNLDARHYGRFTVEYIKHIAVDPELEEYRIRLATMIANFMKRSCWMHNQDIVEDKTIFDDIYSLSEGKLDLHNKNIHLIEIYDKKFNKPYNKNNNGNNNYNNNNNNNNNNNYNKQRY